MLSVISPASYLSQLTSLSVPSIFRNAPTADRQPPSSTTVDPSSPSPSKLNAAPQVYATQKEEIALMLPAPAIKNMVLPGGGAAGVAMAYAIATWGSDKLAQLEYVSGCSCGALIASVVATGYPIDTLCSNLDKTPLIEFLGSIPHFGTLYPEVTTLPDPSSVNFSNLLVHFGRMAFMSLFLGNWQKTGQNILQRIDEWSAQGISMHLQNSATWGKYSAAHQAGQITDAEMERLSLLQKGIWFSTPSEGYTSRMPYMVTFRDLTLLHKIEPTLFKELSIIGSKLADQTEETAASGVKASEFIFNAQNTPNTPIAIAARASICIPFYLQTFWYQGASFVDGGVTNRVPSEIFWPVNNAQDQQANANAHAQTLVLDFRTNGFWDTLSPILYSKRPANPDKTLLSKAIEWFIGDPGYGAAVGEDNQNIYEAGPNTLAIDNDRMGVFDMNASPDKVAATKKAAIASAQQQLALRKNQAYYLSFDNVSTAWDALNEQQKEEVKAAGDPRLDPTFDQQPKITQYAQTAFYALAMSHPIASNA